MSRYCLAWWNASAFGRRDYWHDLERSQIAGCLFEYGGWRPETPFGPQPGINHVDRLVDAQDARDRAELIAEHARTAAVRKALSEAK
jgi:hypothetical protein